LLTGGTQKKLAKLYLVLVNLYPLFGLTLQESKETALTQEERAKKAAKLGT
jgi:hypothetical protein